MYRLLLAYLILSVFMGCSSSNPGLAEDPNRDGLTDGDKNTGGESGSDGWDKGVVVDRDLALVSFVTGQIVDPTMKKMHFTAKTMGDLINQGCQKEGVKLKEIRTWWSETMSYFHYLEALPFGPMNPEKSTLSSFIYSLPQQGAETLIERELQFSQVQGAKYKPIPRPAFLGLDALEYVLFAKMDADDELQPDHEACTYLQYVGKDLESRMAQLVNRYNKEELQFLQTPDGQTRLKEYIIKMTDSLFFADQGLKDRKISAPMGLKQDPYACSAGVDCHSLYIEHPYNPVAAKSGIATNMQALRDVLYGKKSVKKSFGYLDYLEALSKESGESFNLKTGIDQALSSWKLVPEGEAYYAAFANVEAQTSDAEFLVNFLEDLRVVTSWLKSDFLTSLNVELPGGVQGDND